MGEHRVGEPACIPRRSIARGAPGSGGRFRDRHPGEQLAVEGRRKEARDRVCHLPKRRHESARAFLEQTRRPSSQAGERQATATGGAGVPEEERMGLPNPVADQLEMVRGETIIGIEAQPRAIGILVVLAMAGLGRNS